MVNRFTDIFRSRKVIEQHIAVFGESGSGKTMLVSSFYGWHQEASFKQKHSYSLIASDTTQSHTLLSRYLNMKEGNLPAQTTFKSQSYQFSLKVKGLKESAGSLVWHDYPGEWWTEDIADSQENGRKTEAFRSLLQSDVALFLCDGYSLKNEGGRYLRKLFLNFRVELERQLEQVRKDRQKLNLFPRVWIICLSKADLFPDKDVYWFRDQIVASASDDIRQLRELFEENLPEGSFQSIGRDFLLLSSAEIDPETGNIINPDHHIGLDLIPPISIILPIQRALTWLKVKERGQATVHRILESFRLLTFNWLKYFPIVGGVFNLANDETKSLSEKLKELENRSRERGDSVQAIIAVFRANLETSNTPQENSKQIYLSTDL